MCVDVVFDLFICPAMVDPNPVGIIDTPVSYVARSNLDIVDNYRVTHLDGYNLPLT